jgi:hypothetical protein
MSLLSLKRLSKVSSNSSIGRKTFGSIPLEEASSIRREGLGRWRGQRRPIDVKRSSKT